MLKNKYLLLLLLLLTITKNAYGFRTLYYFTSNTCPNCPSFYQALLANQDLIKKYDDAFIIKKENDEEQWKKYVKLYNIRSLPTMVIVETTEPSKNSTKKSEKVLTTTSGLSKIEENGVIVDHTKERLRDILKKFVPKKTTLFRRLRN